MTPAEAALSKVISLTPLIVKTGVPRGMGYPTHYKIDLGDGSTRLAIEVDGGSHFSLAAKERDRKKENFLRGRGWTVLRFSNAEVMGRLEACAQTVSSTISRLRASTPTA
jgi:very-short-patch-repair endonuclease